MWLQTLVVFLVVAGCLVYVVRAMLRKVASTASAGCGSCGGCDPSRPRGCAQPLAFHPSKFADTSDKNTP